MIRIELIGNNIHLQMPYSAEGVDACRSVRGGRWNKDKKRWSYPLDYNTCIEIRTKIAIPTGLKLEIGPELWKWAENEKQRLADIPDANSMEQVPLPILEARNPFTYSALQHRGYQTVGVAFAAAHRQVVIADEPGLGKTIQTIGAIIESDIRGPILVVAPKSAAEATWPQQLNMWAPNESVTSITGSIPKAKRQDVLDAFTNKVWAPVGRQTQRQWLIINPYWLGTKAEFDDKGNYLMDGASKVLTHKLPELFDFEWAACIVDESHDILIANTMNRKKWIQARVGADTLPMNPDGMKIALSGTPMRGKKENFFGTLQWLKPRHYTSYWRWADRHFDILEDGYSKSVGKLLDSDGFYSDLKEVMIRRTKGEVAKDLPAKIYGGTRLVPSDENSPVGIWLEMDGKQAKQYADMLRDGSVNVDGGTLLANGLLSEWTRLKQLATSGGRMDGEEFLPDNPSNKLEWIRGFLEERGISKKPDGDGKVILVSQFAKVCNFLKAELAKDGIPSYILTGATTASKRVSQMEEFQSSQNHTRVFILSTKAGGVSITLDAADDVVILDETYIPDNQIQVEDRAHRVSRPDHQVSIWYLRSLGTIEEAIAATTGGRQEVMDLILDKSRGVDVRKKIQEYVPIKERT